LALRTLLQIKGVLTERLGKGKNTLRMRSCNSNSQEEETNYVITSLAYAVSAKTLQVNRQCAKDYSQACFYYSSAIRVNPQWANLNCPGGGASTSKLRGNKVDDSAPATRTWGSEHRGKGWLDKSNRKHKNCQRDEYPPAYLLVDTDVAWTQGGIDSTGQLIRYLPGHENGGAANMWAGICFSEPLKQITDKEFLDTGKAAVNKKSNQQANKVTTFITATVAYLPQFAIDDWGYSNSAPTNDGLNDNPCWPSGIAAKDPGFALLQVDPYYGGSPPPYTYTKAYQSGSNGS
jgi:hypothetical protein